MSAEQIERSVAAMFCLLVTLGAYDVIPLPLNPHMKSTMRWIGPVGVVALVFLIVLPLLKGH